MNNINFTVTLCAEDRARIDRLIDVTDAAIRLALSRPITGAPTLHSSASRRARTAAQPAQEPTEPAQERTEADAHPVEGAEAFEPVQVAETAEAKPDAPKVSMTDVQQMVIKLTQAGKKAEVKDIVTAYAERVTLIPEDKLTEVYMKLTALEG